MYEHTISFMKTIVLDTSELSKDWMLKGLKYQLLEHIHHASIFHVYVPAVVMEELVANHVRCVDKLRDDEDRLNKTRRRIGFTPREQLADRFDYRDYVVTRFDERLGFTVLPWATVSHETLVERAVWRIPPFDSKGSGYRDALVWSDVLGLAGQGHDVAFVSMDKAFADEDGSLAPELQAEVASLKGSVELVRDFNQWLIGAMPWDTVPDLATAVRYSRNSEFYNYYVQSDFQSDVFPPSVEELGFSHSPRSIEIDEVEWSGEFTPIDRSAGSRDGLTLIEYELGQYVQFAAEFPGGVDIESGWRSSTPDALGMVRVDGVIEMILRVAVLFGDEEFGLIVEEMSWRRADGRGLGRPLHHDDPNQTSLFGFNG